MPLTSSRRSCAYLTVSHRYGQFTYRVGVWLVLTHAVSCKIALSNMYCTDEEDVAATPNEGDTTSCRSTARDPAWWILFLVHSIGFPLVLFVGAFRVRNRFLKGTCCHDTRSTIESQQANTRATGELGLWRYYLGKLLWCAAAGVCRCADGVCQVKSSGSSLQDSGLFTVFALLVLLCTVLAPVPHRLRFILTPYLHPTVHTICAPLHPRKPLCLRYRLRL